MTGDDDGTAGDRVFTLGSVSKTERDLASDGSVDALDDLFDDAEFDDALESALEDADTQLRVDDDPSDDDVFDDGSDVDVERDEIDAELDDVPAHDDEVEIDALDDDSDVDVEHDEIDVEHDEIDAELDDDSALDDSDVEAGHDEVDAADAELTDLDTDDRDTATEVVDPDAEFPEIVQATPDEEPVPEADRAAGPADVEAFVEEELHPDEVAEEILEELRRADIDGPQVEMAPQDESTAARRRPRRAVDYDPAPVPIPARVPRVLARKPRVRRVTRVVRHVDPWSVFKIAIVANLVLYVVVLTAGVLLWNVAHATGTVDNVERFFESFGWETFEFNGGEIYHAAWIAGLFVVIGLTGMAVLLATLFNLITDLVGGVRFTVLEEEVVETRTSPLRRFVVRRPEPEVPAKLSDQSGAMYREAVVDDTGANQRPSR